MKIRVSNLDPIVDSEDLYNLFEEIGEVRSVQMISPLDPGSIYRMAEIEFEDDNDAKKAIEELHGELLFGRPMKVKEVSKTDFREEIPSGVDEYDYFDGYYDEFEEEWSSRPLSKNNNGKKRGSAFSLYDYY